MHGQPNLCSALQNESADTGTIRQLLSNNRGRATKRWVPGHVDICNSRLLRSHMRLKKNRPYNHWLKSQGHYLSCFSTSKRSEPIRFACDMRLKTRYSLKATTKIPPPPTLENKNVPILRSKNTQIHERR